jgi:beta-glucosidase
MNLPIVMPKKEDTLRLFTMGINTDLFKDRAWANVQMISGDYAASKNESIPAAIGQNIDYAIIRVHILNERNEGTRFGGASADELNLLAFSDMATAKSWKIIPSLQDIQTIMKTVGADKTILSIDFSQPYVLDEKSGLLNAEAILATFGVSDAAVMDILIGKFKPMGKLPFALANKPEAIITQDPDAPGYPEKDTLFPFGFGLTY